MFNSYSDMFDYLATIWPWADPKKTLLVQLPKEAKQAKFHLLQEDHSVLELTVLLEDHVLPNGATIAMGASEASNRIVISGNPRLPLDTPRISW
jgi:hypothetical protein